MQKTITSALRAMCEENCEFASRGAARVTVGLLPHDHDMAQFIVAGNPIFSLTFIGTEAELRCGGMGVGALTVYERELAAKALNMVMDLVGIEAHASISRNERDDRFSVMHIVSRDPDLIPNHESCDGAKEIFAKFSLSDFYRKLDLLERRPKAKVPRG